jgi:hypothetical protein
MIFIKLKQMVMQKMGKGALKLLQIQERMLEEHQEAAKGENREAIKEQLVTHLRTPATLTPLKMGNRTEMLEEMLVIQEVTLQILVVMEVSQTLNIWNNMKMRRRRKRKRKRRK